MLTTTLTNYPLRGQQYILVLRLPQQDSGGQPALLFALLRHRCQRGMRYAGFGYSIKPDDLQHLRNPDSQLQRRPQRSDSDHVARTQQQARTGHAQQGLPGRLIRQ